MNFTFKKLTTKFLAVGIGLTIAMSATAVILPHSAYAMSTERKAIDLINTANVYIGRPYQFGAPTNTTRVFDCSSFTKYVFGHNSIYLPRTTTQQSKMGYAVSFNNIKKGDLLFYSTAGSNGRIAHVAINMGGGTMVHTYKKGVGVTYSKINSAYWRAHFITARRVF